jgi:hypothetical protein
MACTKWGEWVKDEPCDATKVKPSFYPRVITSDRELWALIKLRVRRFLGVRA